MERERERDGKRYANREMDKEGERDRNKKK